ncbi:putative phosphoglycerate mutase [Candidatus Methylocalor cossyra]|uniref:Phosphoglycerate mutase n=2 Tax=Candidatus Methylocalor cossyra TaxID=3108543 RepID=A0ABM9NJZ1_9GAMM
MRCGETPWGKVSASAVIYKRNPPMRLILARHGNTFNLGEKVVWIGAQTDLPLVDKGREQAREIGFGLSRAKLKPDVILTGPLARMRETAAIVAGVVGCPAASLKVDDRLQDLDYGLWEGKSSVEIARQFGHDALLAWECGNRWPNNAGWQPSQQKVIDNINSILSMGAIDDWYNDKTVLAVSSSGIFRLMSRLVGVIPDLAKIATGHISLIETSASKTHVHGWNIHPGSLEQYLRHAPLDA